MLTTAESAGRTIVRIVMAGGTLANWTRNLKKDATWWALRRQYREETTVGDATERGGPISVVPKSAWPERQK